MRQFGRGRPTFVFSSLPHQTNQTNFCVPAIITLLGTTNVFLGFEHFLHHYLDMFLVHEGREDE